MTPSHSRELPGERRLLARPSQGDEGAPLAASSSGYAIQDSAASRGVVQYEVSDGDEIPSLGEKRFVEPNVTGF